MTNSSRPVVVASAFAIEKERVTSVPGAVRSTYCQGK